MGTVVIGDPSLDKDLSPSLCNVNMFCIVWIPNPSRYPSPYPAM